MLIRLPAHAQSHGGKCGSATVAQEENEHDKKKKKMEKIDKNILAVVTL